MVVFVEDDLLVDISRDELDGLAKELLEIGQPDPVANTITEQIQKVEDYTLRYAVPDLRAKRIVRALVLHELYARLGSIPEKRVRKYDEAMRELRDIRDGKFTDLAIESPAPEGMANPQAKWGSQKRI